MPKVLTGDLVAGMKLARPVINDAGLVLIGEETELTDELIQKIRHLDIGGVYVHVSSKTLPPRDKALADVESRFGRVESEPHMTVLKRAILDHLEGLYKEYGAEDSEG